MSEIDWALLTRYVAGECSLDERTAVESRLVDDPRYPDALEAIGRVTRQARMTLAVDEQEERVARLVARIAPPATRAVMPRRWRSPALKAAAAVLLVFGASIIGDTVRRQSGPVNETASTHTVTTPRGQRMSLRLADGTQVMLAPASTLRFPTTYGDRNRVVELDGEAMFTVTHDEQRPFIVRTPTLTAEDLGTRFVVRAYRDDERAEVVVAEGEVAVAERVATPGRAVLVPGDRARVTADRGLSVTRGISLDGYFDWTEDRLVFQRTPLREAIVRLGRWYDVDIHLAAADLGDRRFNAKFVHQRQPVSQMLGTIATALRLDLEQTGPRQYTLRAESAPLAR